MYLEDRTIAPPIAYMGDSNQPQQKYDSTGENCKIGVTVFFNPVLQIKLTEVFYAYYLRLTLTRRAIFLHFKQQKPCQGTLRTQ